MNDIFSKVQKTIQAFDNETITVVPSVGDDQGKRYLQADNGGYQFSQRRLLSDIDLSINSIYKNGAYDRQGRRKLFINICRFYLSVANKNTDIDTKNFVLTPADYDNSNIWAVWFLNRQFRNWIKDNQYGKVINELINDFNKYGSCVSKRVGEDIIRVPLRSLKLDQGATSLMDSIKGDVPVIEEHELSYIQMCEKKDVWAIPEEFDGKKKVYEVYSYIKREDLMKLKNEDIIYSEESNEEEYYDEPVLTMSIMMMGGYEKEDKSKKGDNRVLFIEEIDEIPYNECHDMKQDGRWLAIGEIEKQLDNQLAKNLSVNLRIRSMQKAATDVYQTQGDVVAKNLVSNVEDGEVLQVGLNGMISRVDNTTRALVDYNGNDQVWDSNSQQQAFAFESATGESFGSGTPFRLGAMLSNSVMGYFDLKKEKLGLFFQDVFYDKMIPIFQKRAKDDIAVISNSEAGYSDIKNMFTEMYTAETYAKIALDPKLLEMDTIPNVDAVKAFVDMKLANQPFLFVKVPKDVYKNAKYTINLDITGEGRDAADSETLTTLYTTMVQAGDPRAEKVLNVIMASKGKNLAAIAGQSMPTQPTQTEANPDLAGLVPQQ